MSERTERMRNRMLTDFNPIGIEKFRYTIEADQANPNDPLELKQGKIHANVLRNFPIFIMEDELIVGSGASKPYGVELCSGYGAWYQDEIDALKAEGYPVDPQDEIDLQELNKKFKPVGMAEAMNYAVRVSPHLEAYLRGGMTLPVWKPPTEANRIGGGKAQTGLGPAPGWALFCIDYETLLKKGLRAMIAEIDEELEKTVYFDELSYTRSITLQSAKMSMEAMIDYAERFAKLAKEEAAKETREWRKKELEQIAEICHWVPANPARNFREAMQSYWFIYLTAILPNQTTSMGRMDQIMYPYYKADIEAGQITDEEVIEYFECLRIKSMEQESLFGVEGRKRASGKAKWYNMIIGGVKPDGSDASNELTLLILEAILRCPTTHHTVTLRVADSTPDEVLIKAVECQAKGRTMPAFIGDKSYIEYFLNCGATIEQARDYVIAGCNDGVIPGESVTLNASMFVTTLMLKVFLNDGIDENTGMQLGHKTGDMGRFKDFEEFYAAFVKEMEYFASMGAERNNIETMVLQKFYPAPIQGILMKNGIKQGRELFSYRSNVDNTSVLSPVGMVNLGQSLYAIKKLVFEQKIVTLPELKKILDANWEGHEDLRKMCLDLDQYGNDCEEVDTLVGRLYGDWVNSVEKSGASNGVHMRSTGVSISANDPAGAITGATPCGRYKGEIVADGCASPVMGRDHNGILAVLKSAMHIPQERFPAFLLNQKIHPSALQTREDYKKLADALRIYFANNGKHIQFNVVDRETLLAAKAEPEKYEDLMVRVAGYSAYFVLLADRVQDQVINRSEQMNV